ncbi:hypothetical protein K432DRAFT_382001 [Lepidopterella palustris CBS 459.81]|uniref:Uncharacterized protein n=1 Tax=Lepidopterella palustris CBS 459.81 TaxID=1314670 RepID=A0A8E2JFN0_9PEZI|nr:hypothetical protein K432DRAFT_382001 [Lepidopterella palustris CBS 459.81]
MDPSRYRKAYEALTYHNSQVESLLSQSNALETTQHGLDIESPPEQEDPDGMEWAPTVIAPISARCEPPSSAPFQPFQLLRGHLDRQDQTANYHHASMVLSKLGEGASIDQTIEKLVKALPDVLSHDGPHTFTPSSIEVPKDFGMQMSISINHHLALVADRKIMEKFRRLLGYRRDANKRKHINLGFNPVQLIKKQAVVFPEDIPVQVSTLTNDIHPIFRPENFHGCPDDIYEVLKPALRLSTLLMMHRATSGFWHTLVFGKREPCPATSELYDQECDRIRDDVPWSEERATVFEQFLNSQLDTIHFFFHKQPLAPDPHYASMGLVADYKNGIQRQMDGKCHKSKICLHTDFYTTAKRLSLLQYPDPAMVLRFNLFLAICLTHEMAHFIEVSGPHHERPLGRPEVFFYDNMWTESGIAFEMKVFGGRVHPISLRVDCGLGLAVLNYPLKELYDREDNVLYTVPMDYIVRIQQQKTWEQDFSKADSSIFHIPRNGTKSTELNGTNLMIWEDEKDADISDHLDGKETTFHRLDDGQIIKNPNSNNSRRPTKVPEVRRWGPYNRVQTKAPALSVETCVSTEVPDEEKDQNVPQGETDIVEMVDEDVMTP